MIKAKFSSEEYDITLKVLGVLQNEYSPGMVGYSSICNTVEALSHYIQNHKFEEDVKEGEGFIKNV